MDGPEAREEITHGLRSSKVRAWIASPWVSTDLLSETHCNASDCRLIVKSRDYGEAVITDFSSLKELNRTGKWQVRFTPELHAKIYVFDDFAISGSSNFTRTGLGHGRTQIERNTKHTGPDVAELANDFERIWKASRPISELTDSDSTTNPRPNSKKKSYLENNLYALFGALFVFVFGVVVLPSTNFFISIISFICSGVLAIIVFFFMLYMFREYDQIFKK